MSDPAVSGAGGTIRQVAGHRVLLVEDDPAIARMYGLQLRSDGHQVVTCGNGRDALGLVRTDQFDIVLLDLRLPDLDGRELLAELNKSSPVDESIPIVILSNLAIPEVRSRCFELGAVAFLVKSETMPGRLSEMLPHLAGRSRLGRGVAGVDQGSGAS